MAERDLGKGEVIDMASRKPAERELQTAETRVARFAELARDASSPDAAPEARQAARDEARGIVADAGKDRRLAIAVNGLSKDEAPEARRFLIEAHRERQQEQAHAQDERREGPDTDHEHEPD